MTSYDDNKYGSMPDDGKNKWWTIVCHSFSNYGSRGNPDTYKGSFFGTRDEAIRYVHKLPAYDSWGGYTLTATAKEGNHCPTCSDTYCRGVDKKSQP